MSTQEEEIRSLLEDTRSRYPEITDGDVRRHVTDRCEVVWEWNGVQFPSRQLLEAYQVAYRRKYGQAS